MKHLVHAGFQSYLTLLSFKWINSVILVVFIHAHTKVQITQIYLYTTNGPATSRAVYQLKDCIFEEKCFNNKIQHKARKNLRHIRVLKNVSAKRHQMWWKPQRDDSFKELALLSPGSCVHQLSLHHNLQASTSKAERNWVWQPISYLKLSEI